MTVKFRQSFKLKLCAWILGINLLIFSLAFGCLFYYVIDEVRQDVRATVWAKLDYVTRSLDEGLTTTEVSAENLLSISKSPLVPHKRDSIMPIFEHFLEANPRVQGVAVGFSRDIMPDKEKGYCPYVMRMKDGTYRRRDVAEVRDYVSAEWYKSTIASMKPLWSKPFRETNGTTVTSYTLPLTDAQGNFIGVLAIDLNLDIINETLQDVKPYPNAMLTVVDADGTFIAHPNKDYILNESIESLVEKHKDGSNNEMLKKMKQEKHGMGYYEDKERGKIAVFYTTEPKTGWVVTLEVPQKEVAPGLARMTNIIFALLILGLVLSVVVCVVVINKLAKPLETFALAAREISHGNFDVKLPKVESHNELYDLRAALASMKGSLATYIEKLEETTKSKSLIEGELNIARKIQMAMIPKIFPPYPERKDLDVYGTLIPAKAVGGDLYDFVLDGDDFYFCIGDVSGKGVPASLFMAITRSLFRNNVTHAKSPAKIATLLNNAIAQGNDENMFVTMFIGCCNLKTGYFTCCNCGHNAPATNGMYIDDTFTTVRPSQQVHFMGKVPVNLPIGVIEGFEFEEVSIQLLPGVKLLLYTDGITEAENVHSELYGDDRLISTLSSFDINASAEEAVKMLLDDVHKHAIGADQSDDITVLSMNYVGC